MLIYVRSPSMLNSYLLKEETLLYIDVNTFVVKGENVEGLTERMYETEGEAVTFMMRYQVLVIFFRMLLYLLMMKMIAHSQCVVTADIYFICKVKILILSVVNIAYSKGQ